MQRQYSLVMATFEDFDACCAIVHANLALHRDRLKRIVVLNNNPDGPQSPTYAAHFASVPLVKYVPYKERIGSGPAKSQAIKEAEPGLVVCIDSHVILQPGFFDRLDEFYDANPDGGKDLVHGVLIYDNYVNVSTHFKDHWESGMWGQWDTDERYKVDKWFEIPAQGMGTFVVDRDSWLGFHPGYWGFGAEEWVIHEKYRHHGRKVWCVSGAFWWHKFPRVNKGAYPLDGAFTVRNYRLGLREIGIDEGWCYKEYVESGLMSQDEWDRMGDPSFDPGKPQQAIVVGEQPKAGCKVGCGQTFESIEARYDNALTKGAPDIRGHCPTFKEIVAGLDTVVDCGMRFDTHTVAMATGRPKNIYFIAPKQPGEFDKLQALVKDTTTLHYVTGTSLSVTLPANDLTFIDSEPHNFEHVYAELKNAVKSCRRFIVIHDTEAPFGESGQGGGPGVSAAVREFIFNNHEWFTAAHYNESHGLTVLSRDDRDRPPSLPPVWRQAVNYARSSAKHLLGGNKVVPLHVVQQRREICNSNGGRCPAKQRNIDLDRCAKCGCHLEAKLVRPADACPLMYWGNYMGEDLVDAPVTE